LPYVEPFTFLSLRFAFVLILMLPLALVQRAKWPATPHQAGNIAVAGIFIQGGYLGGVFSALFHGMPAGVSALVVGLQPILTALAAAPFLKERVRPTQWLGLALGFGGVMLVMWQKISFEGLPMVSIGWAVVALVSITAGTLYQKRYCPKFDVRTGSVIQFAAGLAVLLPLAYMTETMKIDWTGELVFALAWLVVVLSLGATSVLFYLIERGEATRVASLFYLTPIATTAMAVFIFGETLPVTSLAGMVIGIIGVALVVRQPEGGI
jgi:drug/metabolite transporter (DMT)-like permease